MILKNYKIFGTTVRIYTAHRVRKYPPVENPASATLPQGPCLVVRRADAAACVAGQVVVYARARAQARPGARFLRLGLCTMWG